MGASTGNVNAQQKRTGKARPAVEPVIVSASRSTDIPAFFPEWLVKSLARGVVEWINPFTRVPQEVSFRKTRVMVFWSKNPQPLIPHLPEIEKRGLHYYFQYTVNDYGNEGLEPHVPPLAQRIATFKALSERLGKRRVIWRFDPLILTDALSVPGLLEKCRRVGDALAPYTEKLVFSFADILTYARVARNLARAGIRAREFRPDEMRAFAAGIAGLNKGWGLQLATCAEKMDLASYGISHNRCIDDRLMIELFPHDPALMAFLGYRPDLFAAPSRPHLKDKGQRKACGCIVSKDIGMYNTCPHLCAYCYANTSAQDRGKPAARWGGPG
ncbi:MAG: DUF1848 domain-containing protein [Kiritimatiellia bacterium]|jgi:hypothetical protein|nr:DUF1848 domain-containing protein [Kiritimatiellia bacterium]